MALSNQPLALPTIACACVILGNAPTRMTAAFSCDHAGNCSASTDNPAIRKYRNMYLKSIELIDIIDIDDIATEWPDFTPRGRESSLCNEALGGEPARCGKVDMQQIALSLKGKSHRGYSRLFLCTRGPHRAVPSYPLLPLYLENARRVRHGGNSNVGG